MDTSCRIVEKMHNISPQDRNMLGNDPYSQSNYTSLRKARYQRDQRKPKSLSYGTPREATQKVHCP